MTREEWLERELKNHETLSEMKQISAFSKGFAIASVIFTLIIKFYR